MTLSEMTPGPKIFEPIENDSEKWANNEQFIFLTYE
jgi:hypothetical protein